MILSAQSILYHQPIKNMVERSHSNGMTYGLGPAGYDCRIDQTITVHPGKFELASTMEEFQIPDYLIATVHDKSTWARRGLAVQTTVAEPGWCGFLTLEISNHNALPITIERGSPICQILFHVLDRPTDRPYRGKYQHQPAEPVPAVLEGSPIEEDAK